MKRATNTTRNQRLSTSRQRKQQHLLDVKVRSYKFKQQRNRKAVLGLCKIVLVLSGIAGAYYGGRECLNRFLWKNSDYNVTNIEIHDDGTLSREQVLTASGISEGKNIFMVNLSKARENLSQLPQVEHAELERLLPGRISIVITERKPVAWLTARASDDPMTSNGSFLIDSKGTLIKTQKRFPEYYHFPVIYGFPTENLEAGQVLNAVEIKAALRLLDIGADNTRFQIRSIDLSKGWCMVVSNQSHMQITFGPENVEVQLARLGLLLDNVEGMNKLDKTNTPKFIQTANLMVEHNIPVTFAQPPDESAGTEVPEDAPPVAKPKDKPPAPVKKAEPAPVITHNKLKATPTPVKKALPVKHAFGNG